VKGKTAIAGKREGNLYYLPSHVGVDQANIGLATNKSQPVCLETWHRRLGHRTLDESAVEYLRARVSDMEIQESTKERTRTSEVCETCAIGCQHKEARTGTRKKATELLEIVHSDICGPMQVSTISGERYFITFSDEKSGRIAVTRLKSKSAFNTYRMRADKEAGRGIRVFRTNGGGEYNGQQFESYLRSCRITHIISPPYTPKQNGIAERGNRMIMEAARCMVADGQLDKSFWGLAVATAAHIQNRLPSRARGHLSPLEHWTGRVPSIVHLRAFGSVAHTLVPAEKRSKLDLRSVQCILVGYNENAGSKVYRIYSPTTKRIVSSHDVILDERGNKNASNTEQRGINEIEFHLPETKEKEAQRAMQESFQDGTEGENQPEASDAPEQEEFGGDTIIVRPPNIADESSSNTVSPTHLRRSERNRNQAKNRSKIPWRGMLATADEPQTLQEALGSDKRELWREAWESEVDALMRTETWVLTQLPRGREAIGCRWFFKRKEDGRYKARLVAKGYSQKAGID